MRDKHIYYGSRVNWRLRYDFNNRYSLLYDMLKAVIPRDRHPRFGHFINMTKDYVIVSMIGRQEGGSYTYAEDWAAMHIEDMNKVIPCRIEYLKHNTGGFGWDEYIMKIHTRGFEQFKKI